MLPRKDIIEFLKRYDDEFGIKDNIYYAHKAFKTNSVINYLGELKDSNGLNYDEAEQIFNLLIKYLRGQADLVWENEKILFKLLEGENDASQ